MRFVAAVFVLFVGSIVNDVLAQETGVWGLRAGMIDANSEFAVAERDGRIYRPSAITLPGRL
jgi:hypothetical protein